MNARDAAENDIITTPNSSPSSQRFDLVCIVTTRDSSQRNNDGREFSIPEAPAPGIGRSLGATEELPRF
jgi:hypothetical protein